MKTERCQLCNEPTGRCDEDRIYIVEIRNGRHIGPLCVECMDGIIQWVTSQCCVSPNQQALATKDAEIAALKGLLLDIEYARGYRSFCACPICKWLKDRIRAALAEPQKREDA